MASKWLELLKGVAPQVARVAIIYNPQTAPYASFLCSIETAGPLFAIQPIAMPIQDAGTIEKAIEAALSVGCPLFTHGAISLPPVV